MNSKLTQTNINPFQASIYYNTCMIESVYVGCVIVDLNDEQERELKITCEEPLLIKLGLSRKFPRNVLCSRKSALGVRIMTPKTIIDILKEKKHI